MKIVIESRGKGTSQQDPAQKLETIFSRLAQENDPRRLALARILAAHTPLTYLAAPPVETVIRWTGAFLEFLDQRQDDIAVKIVETEEGEALLLTNSPDAPYLLDSIQNHLARKNLRFQVVSHPILSLHRKQGKIVQLDGVEGDGSKESFILIEIQGLAPVDFAPLEKGVQRTIQAVLQVYRDEKGIRRNLKRLEEAAGSEVLREFRQWLQQGNFLPFSYRCLQVRQRAGGRFFVQEVEGSALGLPPDPQELTCCRERPLADFDQDFCERILRERPVVVETIGRQSPLHRSEQLVYIGFREDAEGGGYREHAFLGLFSQKSMDELVFNIPPLRRRLEQALESLSIPRNCHDYRKTVEIFNTFPKVELFFMEPEDLVEIVRSFTLLYRHGSVKIVPSRSLAVRGLTLLVIMPREFYAAERVGRLETYLRRFFHASTVALRIIHISTDFLSLHVTVHTRAKELRLNLDRLERGLTEQTRPWEMKLRLLLARTMGETEGMRLWKLYAESFSREYRTLIHPRYALRDIQGLERVLASQGEHFSLWGPFHRGEEFYRLQFYSLRESYLNDLMPFLENLNLCVIEEVDFNLTHNGRKAFIKSFAVRGVKGARKLSSLRIQLLDALTALRRGEAENDYLNRLLVLTGLSWKQIDVFRGYRNYLFQIGTSFTKKRVAFALIDQPQIAYLLYRYFEARFRPDGSSDHSRREEALSPLRLQLAEALDSVSDINEDRILRSLFNIIDSTVRTNFFVRAGRPDYFFSFKISALGIIDMPAPSPLFEIYVHSAATEGIHLRGGRVARGGIRWSDRPDDFRTEVLGLMKTQMTKNALIVPVGSKGGFVVKRPWSQREEGAALSKAAYQTFMRGLLDLTDNRAGDSIVPPEGIVAYDEADPYLVVAADKGTAHLPDTANAVSREYGFWLGDAFASGGSHGYDHKKLGITARGAWECVKRHFREMGKDTQSEPFTVIGIGDMSGDVFGNGMLLSRHIRLLAAFDHRHIFIDPDPDPEVSYGERRRLFELPRSSWDDYRRSLISEGGGVWPRSAKDISLSPAVRRWLGVRHESIDGPGLIRLLLGAEADLLWNGGIGTYVKAISEKNEDVGDRANDPLRIDASALHVRVVGEGGNLGFTQRARIEFALAGGRINTDAVDNSAGVDTSDHEVNLKIFMQRLKEQGEIVDLAERDRLLAEVTEEVCEAVLAGNYGQSLCLSLDALRCRDDVEPFFDLSDRLSNAGLLDRRGEQIPGAGEVLARSERALTRPELAVLMAYAKMQLKQALLESDLPSAPGVRIFLESYFPAPLRERFGSFLPLHPLSREIAATVITNTVVNQAGSAFFNRLVRRTGTNLANAVRTYLAFDKVVGGESLRRRIAALDNRISADRQYAHLLRLEETVGRLCLWALENGVDIGPEEEEVAPWRERMDAYLKILGSLLPEARWSSYGEDAQGLEKEGFPAEAARRLAVLPYMGDFLPVTTLASSVGENVYSVAATFRDVRAFTGADELFGLMAEVQVRDRWDRLTLHSLEKRLNSVIFDLTRAVWSEAQGNPESFFARRRPKVHSYRTLQQQLRQTTAANFHPFTVLAAALEELLK